MIVDPFLSQSISCCIYINASYDHIIPISLLDPKCTSCADIPVLSPSDSVLVHLVAQYGQDNL